MTEHLDRHLDDLHSVFHSPKNRLKIKCKAIDLTPREDLLRRSSRKRLASALRIRQAEAPHKTKNKNVCLGCQLADKGIALTFSGHTHGGQIRLPILGGVYAPGLGFLPEYDGGLYRQDDSAMIVSRGIGNSLFPFRVNNDPEVVLAILNCEQKKGT